MSEELEAILRAQYDGGYDTAREAQQLGNAIERLAIDPLENQRVRNIVDAVDIEMNARTADKRSAGLAPVHGRRAARGRHRRSDHSGRTTRARHPRSGSSWIAAAAVGLAASIAVAVFLSSASGQASSPSSGSSAAANSSTATQGPGSTTTSLGSSVFYNSAPPLGAVEFAPYQYQLSNSAKSRLVSWLKEMAGQEPNITIYGFGDPGGSYSANHELALTRAHVVAAFLEAQRIPISRLTVAVSGISTVDSKGYIVGAIVSGS